MNAAIAELQRQAETERRSMQRQLEHLERRQEQFSGGGGAGGRERWAELQGSVSGLLEEMSALSRRVEGLDEKLRTRVAGCEEVVRQRSRDLEQQIHAQQQKAALAASTSEEMAKRHTARLRKVNQGIEEHDRRLAALDEASARRPSGGAAAGGEVLQLEARLAELEAAQAGFDDELRQLASAQQGSAPTALFTGNGSMRSVDLGTSGRSGLGEGDADDGPLRSLERDVQRLAQGIDEHAAALANLRVRSDGQELRVAATYERLETVVSTPLEALRAEVLQLRDHDRQETESQLSHMSRRVQALAEASEDASADLRDSLVKVSGGLQALEPRGEEHASIRKLMDTTVAQEQSIRRLEGMIREPRKGALGSEDLCDVLVRVDTLERRASRLEDVGLSMEEVADKADRTDLMRLEAVLQEMSEPLRRLSQRTASGEAKTAALERQLERLRESADHHLAEGSSRGRRPSTGEDLAALVAAGGVKTEAVSKELGILRARLVEVESQLESGAEGSADWAADREQRAAAAAAGGQLEELSADVARLAARVEQQHGTLQELSADAIGTKRLSALPEVVAELQEAVLEFRGREEELAARAAAAERGAAAGRAADNGFALQQVREDLAELQREAEGKLARLGRAQQELASEVHGQQARVQEELRGVQERDDAAQELIQQVQSQVQQMEEKVKATVAGQDAAKLSETLGRLDGFHAELKKLQARLQDEMRDFEERDETTQESLQQLRKQMLEAEKKPTGPDPAKLSEALGRIEGFGTELQELKASQDELSTQFRSGLSAQEAAQAQLQQPSEEVQEALASAKNAEAKLEELQDAVEGHRRHVGGELQQFRQDLDTRIADLRSDNAGHVSKVTAILASIESGEGETERLQGEVREQLRRLSEASAAAASSAAPAAAAAAEAGALEDLSSALADVKERLQASEEALEAVRAQVAAAETGAGTEVQERLQASAQRMAKAEKGLADLQKELSQSSSTLEGTLDKLRADHELLKSTSRKADDASAANPDGELATTLRAELKELEAQVKEAVDRVEASEAATAAVREDLMTNGGGGASGAPAADAAWDEGLEARVLELQQEVASEVDALRAQRTELAKNPVPAKDGGPGEKVELAVAELAKQIETELVDLRGHQAELEEARGKARGPLAAAAGANGAGTQVPQQLEAQISALFQQVSEELQALAAQQRELGQAKATLADIAGQMKDVRGAVAECTSATSTLRQLVDK